MIVRMIDQGKTYSIVIDQRFVAGKHVYVCARHEVLGMVGVIYLVGESKESND